MASRVSVSFILLVLCVAASIQMPDHGPRSRVKRQDDAEATPAPAPEGSGEEGASASGGGFSEVTPSGGTGGSGGAGASGGGPFAQFNQGREIFSGIMKGITSGKATSPDFWRKTIPLMSFFPSESEKPSGKVA